jgi:hypothetical protein
MAVKKEPPHWLTRAGGKYMYWLIPVTLAKNCSTANIVRKMEANAASANKTKVSIIERMEKLKISTRRLINTAFFLIMALGC